MTLTTALAAALTDQPLELWTESHGWRTTAKNGATLAERVLADPAFREALTAALAEALDATSMEDEEADELREEAAAIVARLLPVEGVRG